MRRSAMRRCATMSCHSGMTLLEVVVVCGLSTFVLGAIGVSLFGVRRVQELSRNDLLRQAAVDRLSLAIRHDAHAATDVQLEGDKLTFMQADGRSICYAAESDGITRIAFRKEQRIHRDTFRLPGIEGARIELLATAPPTARVTVPCCHEPQGVPGAPIEEQIDARVGWLCSSNASRDVEESP